MSYTYEYCQKETGLVVIDIKFLTTQINWEMIGAAVSEVMAQDRKIATQKVYLILNFEQCQMFPSVKVLNGLRCLATEFNECIEVIIFVYPHLLGGLIDIVKKFRRFVTRDFRVELVESHGEAMEILNNL